QPVSDENVDVGGSNPLGLGAPFVVDSAELHHVINTDTLVIGHSTVPQLRQDSGLVIHNSPGNNFDNIGGPIDANIIILKSVHNFVTDLSGALAGLSQINIPLPKLETFNFSGANLTAEEAKKLLPEGSIGELFLELR